MSRPRPGREGHLPPRLAEEVGREIASLRSSPPPTRNEPRCRVCQDPVSRARVNRLLAHGLRVPEIVESVFDINAGRPSNSKITYWSVLRHAERHFNAQEPAAAAWRRILERRLLQSDSEDLAEAAGSVLTAMGYLEVVASKGFENLVDESTVVDFETGLKAQLKLDEMQREGYLEEKVAAMRRDVALLQQAVREVVPAALMDDILSRIDELRGTVRDDVVEAEFVVDDEDDEDDDVGHDPVLSPDSEDPLGES